MSGLATHAGAAAAEEFEGMPVHLGEVLGIAQRAEDERMHGTAGDILDAAAPRTDQMVVILAVREFVVRMVMLEVHSADDAGSTECLESPVDGCEVHATAADAVGNVRDGERFRDGREHRINRTPRGSRTEACRTDGAIMGARTMRGRV